MTGEDNSRAQRESGARLCELKRFDEALAVLGSVVAANPNESMAWCLIAQAQLGLGDHDAALRAAGSAATLTPEEEWPFRLASIALEKLGRQKESIRTAREAVRLNPHEWRTFTRLAMALSKSKGQADEGLVAAQHAVALAPNEGSTHLAVGALSLQLGWYKDAEAAFRRALEIDPQSAAAHNELARLHLKASSFGQAGALADAAEGFAGAVRADPRGATSRHNLDAVLRLFLVRVAYLVFLDAAVVQRILFPYASPGDRAVPLILLALPAAFAWRFVHGLTADLRRHLWRLLFHRKLRVATALESIAVASVIAATFLPSSLHNLGVAVAGTSAILARILLYVQYRASARQARGLPFRPILSNAALWVIASVFSLTALFFALTVSTVASSTKTTPTFAAAIGFSALCFTGVYLMTKARSSH